MDWFLTFENFDLKSLAQSHKENFFKIVGENLNNLKEDLLESNAVKPEIKNKVQQLFNQKMSVEQAQQFLSKEAQEFKDNIKKTKSMQEVDQMAKNFFSELLFLFISLPLDVDAVIKDKKVEAINKDLKPAYNLFNIQDREKILSQILEQWKSSIKADTKQKLEQYKKLVGQILLGEFKKWHAFLNQNSAQRYFIKELPKPKIDEQQKELEGKFHREVVRGDLEKIDASAQPSLIKKIQFMDSKFPEAWIQKFDQPNLVNSGKLMRPEILEILANLEKNLGKELTVTSGFRSPEYQEVLRKKGYRAAKKSTHTEGAAVDVSIVGENLEKIKNILVQLGVTRFGIGKSFLHFDIGDKINPKIWPPFARWEYSY